jgi:curved DNA-binding protein CbpA
MAQQVARAREERERQKAAAEAPRPSAPRPSDQQSLLERMNAALRQASYVGPAPVAPQRPRDEKTDPHYVAPSGLRDPNPSPAPPPQRKPLVLGGQQPPQDDADLWNLVQPAAPSAPAPGGVQSFEEALRRVDTSLEALVGPSEPMPLVEAIVEPQPGPTPQGSMASRIDALDGEEGDSAEAARLRRQRLLKRAMENLGSLPQQGTGPSPSSPTPPPISLSPSQITARPAAAVPPPSAADQQLAQQIEARFAQLARKDHYLTLGLPPSATRDQVKSSFLALAKTFHPDRLPPSLPHLAQKMSAVFEGIREAYETLYDDVKRAAWTATRNAVPGASAPRPSASTGAAPAPAPQAGDLLKMAEVFFKKRDYRQAEQHFAKAYALDKAANTLASQAWSIYMDPSRKADAPFARELMQKALTVDPTSDKANYQLGVIARVEGDMDRAERHFREAVKSNPKHLEANQELRLIEMRKKKASEPKKGGGGFFG